MDLSRITYVEDEADVRRGVVLVLEKLGGYTVDACPNGYEAIARAPYFQPDLLLFDVGLPGLDGEETYCELMSVPGFNSIPIVFLTGQTRADDIARYRNIGIDRVIAKPFNPINLPQQLNDTWRVYHTH